MSDSFNPLEVYVEEKLKKIDPTAKRSPGSGCGASVGDINCKDFFVEAKIKHTKENWILDRKKEYLKLLKQIPNVTEKTCFWISENKFGEK